MNEYYTLEATNLIYIKNKELNDILASIYKTYIRHKDDKKNIKYLKHYLDLSTKICYNTISDKDSDKIAFALPKVGTDFFIILVTDKQINDISDISHTIIEDIVFQEDSALMLLRNIDAIN